MDSVNAPDPTAVREAAVLVAERFQKATVTPADWLGLLRESEMFAGFILAFTDPTPLTVEALVGMGFTVTNGPSRATKGNLSCDLGCTDWVIRSPVSYRCSDVYPLPRTAGELRQLLLRLESPHAAR